MGRTARMAVVAALASPLLLVLAWVAAPSAYALAMAVHAATLVAAGTAMGRAARHGDVRLRRPRRWFTAGLAAAGAGFVVSGVESTLRGEVAVIGFANLAPLVWVPCVLAGLFSVPSQEHREGGRVRAVLDGMVVSAAMGLLSWLLFLQPTWETSTRSGAEKAVLLGYPVIDLVLSIAALAVAAHARADVRRFLHVSVGGLLLVAVADSGNALAIAQETQGFEWHNVVLQGGLALLLVAALLPSGNGQGLESRATAAVDAALPHAPVVVAVCVTTAHSLSGHPMDRLSAVLTAMMVAGVVGRQLLYARHLASVARRLSVDATHDPLTGLYNRRACLRGLETALAERRPGEVAIVLLDLDGFKEVNDSFGHAAGDLALSDVAGRLRAIRDASPARLGGDEFAVVLVGPDAELNALRAADELTRPQPCRIGSLAVPIGGSAGVAVSRVGDATSDLLRRADLAMYEAKRSRLDRVASFAEEMAERAERRHLLTQALPGAAERGELLLDYQPLFRLQDGALAGAEALVRWQSPLHGLVPPEEFIPIAEESGWITDVGLWVLDTAAANLADGRSTGRDLPRLFVNVSPRQLTDGFAEQALARVRAHGVDAGVVTLEVTESAVPDAVAHRCLEQLREAGFTVAMDDFGAGFSSLSQLAVLPVDVLKFDHEFLRGIHTANGRRIVDAIIALAGDLGLTTVAEGVETPAEAEAVRRAGCTLAQGYHFGRPRPVMELWRLLDAPPVAPAATVPAQRAADPVVLEA